MYNLKFLANMNPKTLLIKLLQVTKNKERGHMKDIEVDPPEPTAKTNKRISETLLFF